MLARRLLSHTLLDLRTERFFSTSVGAERDVQALLGIEVRNVKTGTPVRFAAAKPAISSPAVRNFVGFHHWIGLHEGDQS